MVHYFLLARLVKLVNTADLKSVPSRVLGSSPRASIFSTKVAELVDALGLGSSSVKSKGSSPFFGIGGIAQLVERMFCKYEVIGSNPIVSIKYKNINEIFDRKG